jgi:hypothetical protein
VTVDRFQLERLGVEPGDLLVLRPGRTVSVAEAKALRQQWEAIGLPNVTLFVLPPGMSLERVASVMRPMVEGDL